MKAKLFSGKCGAFNDDELCQMPGFSHRDQPEKVRSHCYPFEEHIVRFYVFARNRGHAVKQLRHVSNVRDLNDGTSHECPQSILNMINPLKRPDAI